MGNTLVRPARGFLERAREFGNLIIDRQPPPLFVKGRYLYDGHGVKVILRGINLPLLDDWEFSSKPAPSAAYTPEMQFGKLEELAKTKVNSVRIQWYARYPNPDRPQYDIRHLNAVLEKCQRNCLIPIVELHDYTCEADPDLLNKADESDPNHKKDPLMKWWTDPATVEVLKRHERYLIINLANELGNYRWLKPNEAIARDKFKEAYKAAITGIRNKGLRMPIMIDAPDCGSSIQLFTEGTKVGQQLIVHDPMHSVLLSVHAYWAGKDFFQWEAQVDATVDANLPIVFGEVANKGAEQYEFSVLPWVGEGADRKLTKITYVDECHYALDGSGKKEADADVKLVSDENNNPYKDVNGKPIQIKTNVRPYSEIVLDAKGNPYEKLFMYQDLLHHLEKKDIGWLAWAWYKDKCEPRRMTTNGNYTALTPYGTDILHRIKSKRAEILPMKRISPDWLRRFPWLADLPWEWISKPKCEQDYTPRPPPPYRVKWMTRGQKKGETSSPSTA